MTAIARQERELGKRRTSPAALERKSKHGGSVPDLNSHALTI